MRRPRVLMDVDGVLANFVGATLRDLERWASKEDLERWGGVPLRHDAVVTWDVLSSFPGSQALEDRMRAAWREPGWCAQIPVYDGAIEGLARVREISDVFFVTSPMSSAPHWMWERERWLAHYFNATERDIVFTSSKHLVSGNFLVDDKPSNVIEWRNERLLEPGTYAVLWDRAYNREGEYVPGDVDRIVGWTSLYDYIKEHFP